VHTVQTSRYHPAALVERGYGVENNRLWATCLDSLRYLRHIATRLQSLTTAMTFFSGSCKRHTRVTKFVANCFTDSRRKILYQQSCLQQTFNKLHKVITYSSLRASSKTLVSILQRVIRRDKHPYHVIRIDRPSYCGCAHNVLCKTFRLHDEL
jgi:hypothetical protein